MTHPDGLAAGVMGVLLTLLLHLAQHVSFGYTENTFLTGVERASSLRRVLALLVGGALVGVGWWLRRRWVDNEAVSVTHALRGGRPRLTVPATIADAVLQIVVVDGRRIGCPGGRRRGRRLHAPDDYRADPCTERLARRGINRRGVRRLGCGGDPLPAAVGQRKRA